MIKINNKFGIVFWVTGLAGSGKTTIAKKLKSKIQEQYGTTIVLSGDEIRNIFNLKGYTYNDRLLTVRKYQQLIKKLSNQKVNVIFAVIGMMNEVRKLNKKLFKNYVEIFIKPDIKILKRKDKKKLYSQKKNVVGKDIKPELPLNPTITVNNNFNVPITEMAEKVFKKIVKIIKI